MTSALPRIVALLTCHNRRETTLACLRSLADQQVSAEVSVVLVDDGSTDGTAEAVRRRFPGTVVVPGTGQLYWAGGMRRAQAVAVAGAPDHLLWLNDDVELAPGALAALLACHDQVAAAGRDGVIVGACTDRRGEAVNYGGYRRTSRLWPTRYARLPLSDAPAPADAMNGNCVLVPRAVYRAAGPIDAAFHHGMGDFDYALRARRLGFPVWVAPGRAGVCDRHEDRQDDSVSLPRRLRAVCSRKGLPPDDWLCFTRRHAGVAWPVFFLSPYLHHAAAAVGARMRARLHRAARPLP